MVINGIGIGIGLGNIDVVTITDIESSEPKPKNYLTIEALEDGLTAKLSRNACEYCVDGDGDWKTLSADTPTESINAGQTLSFRGNLASISSSNGIGTFTISKKCNISGNVMSMLFGDNAQNEFSLSEKFYIFYDLFYKCSKIISAKDLYLPATELADSCYKQMFYGCSSLTTAPELPATKLAQYCYNQMFLNCTSLTMTPELPATTLVGNCYDQMFQNCTSLITAPELPATKLARYCYQNMFSGCTSLNYIKMLATDISASNCLYNWVKKVASTGTFIKHPDMTSLPTGESGIPSGWNIVNEIEIEIEIDYKRFSIINNSDSNEIILHNNDGIYSSIKGNHIDLYEQYDENTIYSFTPERNLNIDIYKVSQDNIGILKLTDVIWGSAVSLEELCYTYNINNLDGILIIIKSIDDNYNDGYDYYNDEYDY